VSALALCKGPRGTRPPELEVLARVHRLSTHEPLGLDHETSQQLGGALKRTRTRPSGSAWTASWAKGATERALQPVQIGEQRRDLRSGVLVDAVQADEGVEDDESGPQVFDLDEQPCAVGRDAEADNRIDDDMDIEASPVIDLDALGAREPNLATPARCGVQRGGGTACSSTATSWPPMKSR